MLPTERLERGGGRRSEVDRLAGVGSVFLWEEERCHAAIPLGDHPQLRIQPGAVRGEESAADGELAEQEFARGRGPVAKTMRLLQSGRF